MKSFYPDDKYGFSTCYIERIELTGDEYPEYFVFERMEDLPMPSGHASIFNGATAKQIHIDPIVDFWSRPGTELETHSIDLNSNDDKKEFYTVFYGGGIGGFYAEVMIYSYNTKKDSLEVLFGRESLLYLSEYFPGQVTEDYYWFDFVQGNKKSNFKTINIFKGRRGKEVLNYKQISNTGELVKKFEFSKAQNRFVLVYDKTDLSR